MFTYHVTAMPPASASQSATPSCQRDVCNDNDQTGGKIACHRGDGVGPRDKAAKHQRSIAVRPGCMAGLDLPNASGDTASAPCRSCWSATRVVPRVGPRLTGCTHRLFAACLLPATCWWADGDGEGKTMIWFVDDRTYALTAVREVDVQLSRRFARYRACGCGCASDLAWDLAGDHGQIVVDR